MTSLGPTVPLDPVSARLHPRLHQRADRLAQLIVDPQIDVPSSRNIETNLRRRVEGVREVLVQGCDLRQRLRLLHAHVHALVGAVNQLTGNHLDQTRIVGQGHEAYRDQVRVTAGGHFATDTTGGNLDQTWLSALEEECATRVLREDIPFRHGLTTRQRLDPVRVVADRQIVSHDIAHAGDPSRHLEDPSGPPGVHFVDTLDLDDGDRVVARLGDPLEDRRGAETVVAEVGGHEPEVNRVDHTVSIDIGTTDIALVGRGLVPDAEDQVRIGDVDLVVARGITTAQEAQRRCRRQVAQHIRTEGRIRCLRHTVEQIQGVGPAAYITVGFHRQFVGTGRDLGQCNGAEGVADDLHRIA